MSIKSSVSAAALLLLSTPALALGSGAGPNTLHFYNYERRTASYNAVWMVVPVARSAVQTAVGAYGLLSECSGRLGLPNGTHPVLVGSGYMFDVATSQLHIPSLMSAYITVPCVDALRDGKTPFQLPVANYIGAADADVLASYIPVTMASLTQLPVANASMAPNTQAYQRSGPDLYWTTVQQVNAANGESGPGSIAAAIDMQFSCAPQQQPANALRRRTALTEQTFHGLINQVYLSPTSDLCYRNPSFFNESFARPELRTGTVTLYEQTDQPAEFSGRYERVSGFSANAVQVAYDPQDCAEAAAQNERTAVARARKRFQ